MASEPSGGKVGNANDRVCEKSWDRRLPAGPSARANASVMAHAPVTTGAGWQPAVPGAMAARLRAGRQPGAQMDAEHMAVLTARGVDSVHAVWVAARE